jgi:hypothetical protein
MGIEKVSPETVALASNLHPSKHSGSNLSVAEKAAERGDTDKIKSETAVTRARGIKVDVDT